MILYTYSLSVAWDIHPSDSQMNVITSILQGHYTIACLPTVHGNSPIKNCKRRNENQHIQS